jgi:hypothetical protein
LTTLAITMLINVPKEKYCITFNVYHVMQFNSYNNIYEQRWPFLYVKYYVVNYLAVYFNDQSIHFLENNCIVKGNTTKNLLTLSIMF